MLLCWVDGSIVNGHWGKAGTKDLPAHIYGGWVVKHPNGDVLHHHAVDLGEPPGCSATHAEYGAMRSALRWLYQNDHTAEHIQIFSDSQVSVYQLTGKYQAHSTQMRMLRDNILLLAEPFAMVSYHWIPRSENRYADYMSKAILKHGGAIPPVPLDPEVVAKHR